MCERYDGEWWDIGSLFCNALWYFMPLIIYIIMAIEYVQLLFNTI